jgi:apolipoprotein N-acyltransferase
MRIGFLPRLFATALLLILSFPGPDMGPFMLVALVPLLGACARLGGRKAFLAGWATGTCWLLVSYSWVSNSLSIYGGLSLPLVALSILTLATLHGFYIGVFTSAVPALARRPVLVQVMVLPSLWTLLEVARTWFPAPFPWLMAGSAFWKTPLISGIYPVAGVYGASFWAILVNVLWYSFPRFRDKQLVRYAIALIIVVLAVPLALTAAWKLPEGKQLRVGIVQGNFDQELKWDEARFEETVSTYLGYTDKAVRDGASLVVWPETAMTSFYQAEPALRDKLRSYSSENNVHLVFGSPGYEIQGQEILLYNRVYHLSPDGLEQHYNKIQLVPFGEYIPFFGGLTFVERLVPGDGEFARGDWKDPFATPEPSGALVCYEVSFPGWARRQVRGGAKILINVTNDSWFGRTWGPYQHLAISTIRAAENRVPLLRSANTGVSAVVDARGRIADSIPVGKRDYMVADITIPEGRTVYTRWGDWIVTLSAAVITLFVSITVFLRGSPRTRGGETDGPVGWIQKQSRRGNGKVRSPGEASLTPPENLKR